MAAFVSVKLSSTLRPQTFLVPEPPAEHASPADSPQTPPPLSPSVKPGDTVVVDTGQGAAIGAVTATIPAIAPRRQPADDSPRKVVRRATREDMALRLRHEQREREAFQFCGMKIREHGLSMKLTKVEQAFDGSRIVFFYTAEERVDFRELVRELAAHFRMRIEMRQIGVRDEAKMLGGYGPCGQSLCCTTWLASFEPVTIKMAKQQNLSLNPSRLSGMCGRLKCCLRYEIADGKVAKQSGCGDEGACVSASETGGCARSCGSGGACGCRE